jgi:hypothetical protein
MIGRVITLGLGFEQENHGFVGNFFNRRRHFAGVQGAVAAIDHHDAFLGDNEAASRGGRVRGVRVDPIFDFRESGTKVLRSHRGKGT